MFWPPRFSQDFARFFDRVRRSRALAETGLSANRFGGRFRPRCDDLGRDRIQTRDDRLDRRDADDTLQRRAVERGGHERRKGSNAVFATSFQVAITVDADANETLGDGAKFGPRENVLAQLLAVRAPRCFKQNEQRLAFAAGSLGGGDEIVVGGGVGCERRRSDRRLCADTRRTVRRRRNVAPGRKSEQQTSDDGAAKRHGRKGKRYE